jgi:hypothetical protein
MIIGLTYHTNVNENVKQKGPQPKLEAFFRFQVSGRYYSLLPIPCF